MGGRRPEPVRRAMTGLSETRAGLPYRRGRTPGRRISMVDEVLFRLSRLGLHEILILAAYPLFWLWLVLDCWKHEPRKAPWMIVLLIPFGACAYYVHRIRRRSRANPG